MTDIVERLRCLKTGNPPGTDTVMIGHACNCQVCEAADEIERLRRDKDQLIAIAADEMRQRNNEIERLRAENYQIGWALEEIIQSADLDDGHGPVPNRNYYCISTHLIDSARAAIRAALIDEDDGDHRFSEDTYT